MCQRPFQRPGIEPIHPGEEPAVLRVLIGGRVRQLQEPRAEHRRQRETDEHRHHHGKRHRPAKRIDEAAGVAGHERHGQKDDDERQRRRHDRERHFAGPLDGGFERRAVFFFDVAEDVLQHDNGIVDHDADGERDAEQCHAVQREIHRPHERERRDNRCRNRERGNDHGADVADEEHDDHGGQQAAPQQVLFERREGGVDEP